jgi:hypothetical protein
MENRLLIGVILLAGFIMAVSAASMYAQFHILSGTLCGCGFPVELLIPLLSSAGLLVGSLVYYFISSHKEKKDYTPLLSLVDYGERIIISEIAKAGGCMAQSSLVEKTGFNKVKVSRLVTELGTKGVIRKSANGVTNNVELEPKIRELIC